MYMDNVWDAALGMAQAVTLAKSIIAIILLVGANKLSNKVTDSGLF